MGLESREVRGNRITRPDLILAACYSELYVDIEYADLIIKDPLFAKRILALYLLSDIYSHVLIDHELSPDYQNLIASAFRNDIPDLTTLDSENVDPLVERVLAKMDIHEAARWYLEMKMREFTMETGDPRHTEGVDWWLSKEQSSRTDDHTDLLFVASVMREFITIDDFVTPESLNSYETDYYDFYLAFTIVQTILSEQADRGDVV